MTFGSLEEVREYFKNDKFATNAGMQVEEFSDDEVLCSVELTDDHKNANGGICQVPLHQDGQEHDRCER